MSKLIKIVFVLAVAVVAVAAQQVISVHGRATPTALAASSISPLQIMQNVGPVPVNDYDITP